MAEHDKMRASDADRQAVITYLRTALDEGRLKMDEYLDRMGQATEAATYGELTPLYADLPGTTPIAWKPPVAPPPAAAEPAAAVRRHGFAGLPAPLRAVWRVWAGVVSINLVVWVLVCATAGQLIYPWPIWVAGPWGAVLLFISLSASRGQPDPHRLPPGPDAARREGSLFGSHVTSAVRSGPDRALSPDRPAGRGRDGRGVPGGGPGQQPGRGEGAAS